MASTRSWCLIVNHEWMHMGPPFQVDAVNIASLKERVREKNPNALGGVDARLLDVWRCREHITSFNDDRKVEERIKEMRSNQKLEKLEVMQIVADLQLQPNDLLLVQKPEPSGEPPSKKARIDFHQDYQAAPLMKDEAISTMTPSNSQESLKARGLTPYETRRPHQIAFRLYEGLWNRGEDAWTRHSHLVEDYVPDLVVSENTHERPGTTLAEVHVLDETDKKTKATLVDLTSLLDWTPADARLRMLTPRFLIRDEYIELDKYLNDEEDQTHTVLVGQPGIGKTTYLTFSLLKRLSAGRPTIYAMTRRRRYLFVDSGVYWIPGDSFELSDNQVFVKEYQDALVLFDLNDKQSVVGDFQAWRMLVSSSPQQHRYKEWCKQDAAQVYVMSTWLWPEVFLARSTAFIQRDPEDLRGAFIKYGGTARNLFNKLQDQLDEEIRTAINNCNDIGSLFPSGSGFQDTTSYALILVNPRVDENGILQRLSLEGQIASRHILEQLLQRKQAELVDSMQRTFQMLFHNNGSRSASGILFEGAGHQYLRKSLIQPLNIRPLADNQGSISLNLRHVQSVEQFGPSEIGSFNQLNPKHYYQPLSSTTAGIDSFALEVDGAGVPLAVVLFQFTIAMNHPINPPFLSNLRIKHSWAATLPKWKLVFVVPQENESSFSIQKWKSQGNLWDCRVSQYVLGVDTEKLWDALRTPLPSNIAV